MSDFNKDDWCWRQADGRVWSTKAAAFVNKKTAAAWLAASGLEAIPPAPNDEAGEASEAGLRAALEFYGLPLGELMTLDEARAAKIEEVFAGYSAAFTDVEKAYPQWEREGWAMQEAESAAYLADSKAPTPVLSALVQLRNRSETVAEFAADVMARATQYRGLYAWYTGQQQRMYGEVIALTTVQAVQAYQVTYETPIFVE